MGGAPSPGGGHAHDVLVATTRCSNRSRSSSATRAVLPLPPLTTSTTSNTAARGAGFLSTTCKQCEPSLCVERARCAWQRCTTLCG
ncbi:hypothetical protein BDA96_02G154300 [Sorghum bicolor]|uniref:Uncharacterized protein n=2 Tax=Sorghum bicolor TaxID=4558 RepID=A0A921USH1_SORBI|nr:hypothetical protein BDA96_02G154300 [Sorghum bicolor]OQU89112.1 hypothetical protein SORBI_3002G148232 [Sorghum bicolor]